MVVYSAASPFADAPVGLDIFALRCSALCNSDHAKFSQPGVIWCINLIKVRKLLPIRLQKAIEGHGFKLTIELLEKANINSMSDLRTHEKRSAGAFLLMFEPPALDQRIVNQYALFSLMSRPRESLSAWLMQKPDLCERIIIAASLKAEIRDNLDQANINERILFPGLDGLSQWLARYYSPSASFKSRT